MGLFGSSAAMEFLKWAGKQPQTTLLVCPDDEQAALFYQECLFFQKSLPSAAKISFFPARESDFKPSQYLLENILDQRLSALYQASEKKPSIIIASFRALSQKTIPHDIFRKNIHGILLHDDINRDQLLEDFVQAGYERETTCQMMGTFSVRGDIIDFFSPNHAYPIRMEFFGDQVERLSYFNPDSQTSIPDSTLEYVDWIPCKEILLKSIQPDVVIRRIKQLADDANLPPMVRTPIEDAIRENIFLPTMQTLLPLFYDSSETLIDHLPSNTLWVLFDPLSLHTEYQNIDFELQKNIKIENKLQPSPQDYLVDMSKVEKKIWEKTKLYISDVEFKPQESIFRKTF